MELEISNVRPPLVHIIEPPPIRESGDEGTGVFVEAVIEVVAEQVYSQGKYYSSWPMLSKGGKHRFDHDA